MRRDSLPFETVGEMLEQLGNIDPRRVRSSPPPGLATEKDVLALLDRENRLYELVDGVLVEKVMGLKESMVAAHLVQVTRSYAETHDLGLVAGADGTMKLWPRLVRIPDVSFFAWHQFPDKQYPAVPIPELYPDLAVEVLSEGNTLAEMERKLKEYFLAGTRLVWFVDPDARTVEVYTSPDESTLLTEADTLTGGDVLPGFTLALKELFARVPRPSRSKQQSSTGRGKQKRRSNGRQKGKL
jgi:Uma2 family endonuclease